MRTWYRKELKPRAQELRRNMTPQEKKLWYQYLKLLPFPIKRQRIIEGYIADFYIPAAKLVIELDGSQHFTEEGQDYDAVRDDLMKALGLTIIRIPNREIDTNFEGVCLSINDCLKNLPLTGKVASRRDDG